MISLVHLREVKLGGFSGHEYYCCLDMVQLLLASAPTLERMVVTAKVKGRWRPKFNIMKVLESSLPRGRGKWTARRVDKTAAIWEYEWTLGNKMPVTGARDALNY